MIYLRFFIILAYTNLNTFIHLNANHDDCLIFLEFSEFDVSLKFSEQT